MNTKNVFKFKETHKRMNTRLFNFEPEVFPQPLASNLSLKPGLEAPRLGYGPRLKALCVTCNV